MVPCDCHWNVEQQWVIPAIRLSNPRIRGSSLRYFSSANRRNSRTAGLAVYWNRFLLDNCNEGSSTPPAAGPLPQPTELKAGLWMAL